MSLHRVSGTDASLLLSTVRREFDYVNNWQLPRLRLPPVAHLVAAAR